MEPILQICLAVLGIQTAIIIALMSAMWYSMCRALDKIDAKFEKIDGKFDTITRDINEMKERIAKVETLLHMKECCVLKDDAQLKKAE